MERETRKVWVKIFGFKVGDNVILKRGNWRKKRFGIIVFKSDLLIEKPFLVHFGMERAKSNDLEYRKSGIFEEKEMEIDEVQRVKTFEERQEERNKSK